ncbi:DsbE family thiol:disulfide interchange protein [Pseudomaricurvus alkylphenolicus]|jgi:cytochrome c biogenesis protein CcmG/thiol:disulfide interchange protein DsbE|uniref:DsbE family thiol:disulfide interchange protein n=1 Tax=Pseudomaricurvus alkylphenolicus TaxID=1306991 RepID=UPI0014226FAC|nr:DsbE family thiol:disulfide interchange protein [Pseudomaricurvus alkylphenolicus]NIB44519.1 DsbE family thiol:disulfide interchange protein [Pseudomaricurvus alkylphenolicus]
MSRIKLFIPLIIFLVLAVFFWRGLSLDPTAMPSALIDKPLPQFSLGTVHQPDRKVTQDDLKGEVALLNVWATWCVSCRVEHPVLIDLARQGVKIYGVNYKDDVPAAVKWLKDLENPYVLSVVDADGRLGIDLGVFGAPETYVLDKQGVIRYKHVGVVTEEVWAQTLEPIVRALEQS